MPKIYTSRPIPADLVLKLEKKLKFKPLDQISGSGLTEAVKNINRTVSGKIAANIEYSKYCIAHESGTFVSAKSIKRYFKEKRPIHPDKLNILRCFCDATVSALELSAPEIKVKSIKEEIAALYGAYFGYIYDFNESSTDKIKKAPFSFDGNNGSLLQTEYRSPLGWLSGTGDIINNSIVIYMYNPDRSIQMFLTAKLPESIDDIKNDNLILNFAYISNSHIGTPMMGNMLVVRNASANEILKKRVKKEEYMAQTPKSVHYSLDTYASAILDGIISKNRDKDSDHNLLLEREITLFLSNPETRSSKFRSFLPGNIDTLSKLNQETLTKNCRLNYEKLKMRLSNHTFYSFNRSIIKQDQIAFFIYTFKFSDAESKCFGYRHRIGNPKMVEFEGEVYSEGACIFMVLTDSNNHRRKQFIAPFLNIEEKEGIFILRGITSSVSLSVNQPIALRELIVGVTDKSKRDFEAKFVSQKERVDEYISYEKFRAIPETIISQEDKLFIASQSMSILSYPSKDINTFVHTRMNNATRFQGIYHLLTFYIPSGKPYLHLKMTIDSLSIVTLQVKYTDLQNEKPFKFTGICEYYSNSLHISVHHSSNDASKERHSDFISNPIQSDETAEITFLTGINLTTDRSYKAQALTFLAIPDELLQPRSVTPMTGTDSDTFRSSVEKFKDSVGVMTKDEVLAIEHILKEKQFDYDSFKNYKG